MEVISSQRTICGDSGLCGSGARGDGGGGLSGASAGDVLTDLLSSSPSSQKPLLPSLDGENCSDVAPLSSASSLTVVDPDVAHMYFALLGVAGAIVCLFGLVGNVLNIGALATTVRRSRTPTYHILLALAASDAMVMIIYAAFALTFFARRPPVIRPEQLPDDSPPAAVVLFSTWYLAINVFVCASNWYVVAVTFFRFLAVYFPMKVAVWCTVTRVRLVIVSIGALSAAVCVPDMFTIELYHLAAADGGGEGARLRFRDTALYADPLFVKSYYTVQTVVLHLLPFTINLVLVIVLIRTLFRSGRELRRSINVRNARGREVDQRRVSVMLVVVVLFSLATTLPSIVYRLMRDFAGVRSENEGLSSMIAFRGACDIIELLNYASNFYLYVASNPSYRRLFVRSICCRSTGGGSGRSGGGGSITQYSLVADDRAPPPSRQHSAASRSVRLSNGNSNGRSNSIGGGTMALIAETEFDGSPEHTKTSL